MARHVILGKGPIGRTLAGELVRRGHEVVVASRSGGPARWRSPVDAPPADRIEHTAVDATDVSALSELAAGAATLYNCLNPAYHRWPDDWPPVHEAVLGAAESSGAVLVMAGNLYGYGEGTQYMTETSPLRSVESKGRVRAQLWAQAERRHRAGRLRVTELRGSDYLGPEAEEHALAGPRILRPLLGGGTVRPVGRVDVPHTWTYLPDFARAMATAADTPQAWGRAWHVPSPEPLTVRELIRRFATGAGLGEPTVRPVPMPALRLVGLVQPMMRELAAVGYQHTQPFVMESTASQEVLGLAPSPWNRMVDEILAAYRTAEAVGRS